MDTLFPPMRRKDRALGTDETRRILEVGHWGTLAVMGNGGYPYAIPVDYVLFEDRLYFHCMRIGHKLDAIRRDDKVSFSVVTHAKTLPDQISTAFESAVVFGRAREVGNAERVEALKLLVEKYMPDHLEQGMDEIRRRSAAPTVVRIDIEHMSGKARRE